MINDPKVREYLVALAHAELTNIDSSVSFNEHEQALRDADELYQDFPRDMRTWLEIHADVNAEVSSVQRLRKVIDLLADNNKWWSPFAEPEQPAPDIPAEYARLKAKYGDKVFAQWTNDVVYLHIAHPVLVALVGVDPSMSPTDMLDHVIGLPKGHSEFFSGGDFEGDPWVYEINRDILANAIGLTTEDFSPYLILKAYDELQAAPELQPSQTKISASQRGEVKGALKSYRGPKYRYDPEATAALRAKGKYTLHVPPGHEDAAESMIKSNPELAGAKVETSTFLGLPPLPDGPDPADDYDDDLRPALMLPKGDPIREAALKVHLARRGKG